MGRFIGSAQVGPLKSRREGGHADGHAVLVRFRWRDGAVRYAGWDGNVASVTSTTRPAYLCESLTRLSDVLDVALRRTGFTHMRDAGHDVDSRANMFTNGVVMRDYLLLDVEYSCVMKSVIQ